MTNKPGPGSIKNTTTRKSIIIEVILFFTYAFFAVSWVAGSNLTPQIMAHFGLKDFASATFISNAISFAKILGNFLAATILYKLYPKKAVTLGAFSTFAGCLVAILAPHYLVFVLGRFIMGFGGALIVVYFNPFVVQYFSPKDRPTVNAINSVASNVGNMLGLVLVGPVVGLFKTWQPSMGFFAAISGLLFFAWLIFGEDFEINVHGKHGTTKIVKQYGLMDALKERINWLFPLTYSGLMTLYVVLLNVFPLSDQTLVDAKTLSTLVAMGGILGSVLAIALSKRYHKRLPVIRICGLLMTFFGYIMVSTGDPTIEFMAAFATGVFMFLPITSLVMITQELPGMTPAKLTQVMGLFWAISYVIESIAFYIIGLYIDKMGYSAGLYISLGLSLTFFLGSFILPETGKDKIEKI